MPDDDAFAVDAMSSGERALGALLAASHLAAPHDLPRLIVKHLATVGGQDAVAYLADLQQQVLVPLTGSTSVTDMRQLEPLSIDSTLAGRAYQQIEVLTTNLDRGRDGVRVWLPLLNGSERLGVLGLTVGDPSALDAADGVLAIRLRRLASLIAELVMTKTLYGDSIVQTRRRAQMGLAAEIQWGLLPPLTFACDQVVIAGALEPAYEVAGDSVDYAVDESRARIAIFDGMGHSLASAQLATLAVAAYRNARRAGHGLTDTARRIDISLQEIYAGEVFATGVVAELDTDTGHLTWINAGHPPPLLLREARLVKLLETDPGLPFGLGVHVEQAETYAVGSEHLQPGDRLLFYTDGVIETRSPDGEFFGVERLVDLVTRNFAGGLNAPETMRRVVRSLLEHQQGQLDDDATLMLVQWHGEVRPLLP